jgi:hypothetical protein
MKSTPNESKLDATPFENMLDLTNDKFLNYIRSYSNRPWYPIVSIVAALIFLMLIITIEQAIGAVSDATQKLILLNMMLTALVGFLSAFYKIDFQYIVSILGILTIPIAKKLHHILVK